jgi:hypothetical protein
LQEECNIEQTENSVFTELSKYNYTHTYNSKKINQSFATSSEYLFNSKIINSSTYKASGKSRNRLDSNTTLYNNQNKNFSEFSEIESRP